MELPAITPPYHYNYDYHNDSDDETEKSNAQVQGQPRSDSTNSQQKQLPFTYRVNSQRLQTGIQSLVIVTDSRCIQNQSPSEWQYAGVIFAPDSKSLSCPSNISGDAISTTNPAITKLFVSTTNPSLALVLVSQELPVYLQFHWNKVLFSIITPQRVLVIDNPRDKLPPTDPMSVYIQGVAASVLNNCDVNGINTKYISVGEEYRQFSVSDIELAFEKTEDISLSKPQITTGEYNDNVNVSASVYV